MAELSNFQLFSSTINDPSYQPTRLLCLNKNTSLICHQNTINITQITSNSSLSSSSSSSSILDYNSGNIKRNNIFSLKSINKYELFNSKVIQSICKLEVNNNNNNNKEIITTIDSSGTINILQLIQNKSHNNSDNNNDNNYDDENNYELNCVSHFQTNNSNYHIGWVGLTKAGNNNVASCHHLSRELIWSDLETQSVQKKVLLPGNPTCISSSYQNPNIVFTGDDNGRFSVWDIRQSDKESCIHSNLSNRSSDALYSILQIRDNSVAITGSEKTLQLIDMRTWKGRFKLTTPCKYDVIHLLKGFSNKLYLAGRDNEILSCELPPENIPSLQKKRKHSTNPINILDEDNNNNNNNGTNNTSITTTLATTSTTTTTNNNSTKLHVSHQRGIRAESYWCGLDIVSNSDDNNDNNKSERIVGLCGKGKLYVLDKSNEMRVASSEDTNVDPDTDRLDEL